jgi:hypothetical protein
MASFYSSMKKEDEKDNSVKKADLEKSVSIASSPSKSDVSK